MGAAPLGAVSGGFITAAADTRMAILFAAAVSLAAGGVLLAALRHIEPALEAAR